MPIKRKSRLTAWSFSRYSDYRGCPFLASLKHIVKLKEPKGPALIRGSRIHKEAERYSTGELRKRPESLDLFPDEFTYLRKIRKRLDTEQQLAVDVNYQPCDWFSSKAWLRVIVDCKYLEDGTLEIIDYKTGKVRDEQDQLEICAMIGAIFHPEAKRIRAKFWFLDHGEVIEANKGKGFTRAETVALQKKWTKNTRRMLNDTTFKATPGEKCFFCFFGQKAKKGRTLRDGTKIPPGPGLCKF